MAELMMEVRRDGRKIDAAQIDGARESGGLSVEAESKVIGHGFARDAAER